MDWTIAGIIANIAQALSAAVSVFFAFWTIRETRRIWHEQKAHQEQADKEDDKQALEARKVSNYLELEVNSSKVFAFTAENSDIMAPYRGETPPPDWNSATNTKARETTLNLYFQSLNLFEVCARMRKHDQFPPEVFASWVSWFMEILDSWFFRHMWDEIRTNYTEDVRHIFDVGCDIWQHAPEENREAEFYRAVAQIMCKEDKTPCSEIANWPAKIRADRRTRNDYLPAA